MKAKSSIWKIVWSLAYVFLIALIVGTVITSQPITVGATSQQDERKSLEQAFDGNPQLRVTKIKTGPHIRKFKEAFDESDDWAKRLSLEVESVATKPITFLSVNLNFPETKVSGSMMSFPVEVGIRQGHPSTTPLKLMPGEKFELSVGDNYERLEQFIGKRHSMHQIHKMQVEIGFIIFEDGTAWAAGDFLRPDPNNPTHYINVGRAVPN
jgi:hypothetical protein